MSTIYIDENLSLKNIVDLLFAESRTALGRSWVCNEHESFYQDLIENCLSVNIYSTPEVLLICNVLIANYLKVKYRLDNITLDHPDLPNNPSSSVTLGQVQALINQALSNLSISSSELLTIDHNVQNIYYTEEQFIPNSANVFLNGLKQRKTLDYSIVFGDDPTRGIGIELTFPILSGDSLEVTGAIIR